MILFKDEIKGTRINLIRTTDSTKGLDKIIFDEVSVNREHLDKFMPWMKHIHSVDDIKKYLQEKENEYKEQTKIEYGIFIQGKYSGNIGVFNISSEFIQAEIGYWLSRRVSGKGFMKEAVNLIVDDFFERLNFQTLLIKCDFDNLPSQRVATSVGFKLQEVSDLYRVAFGEERKTYLYKRNNK